MRTTIDINDALLRDLRRRAGSEGRSFKQVIEDVLHRGLGRQEGAAKRIKIPAYAIGLKPAYRAVSMNQIYDQLEQEETARMADR